MRPRNTVTCLAALLLGAAGCTGTVMGDPADAGATADDGGILAVDSGAGGGDGAPGADAAPPGTRKTTSLGLGLSGIADWSTEYPFVDFMKQSREWQDWQGGGGAVTTVDENGWVNSLAPGQTAGTVFLTVPEGVPPMYPRLVVRWSGQGTISYRWSAQKIGTASGGDLVQVGEGSSLLQIDSVDPADPIRDITIVPEAHLAAFDAGAIFNPDFLALLRDFRAVRFMDWMATNGSLQEDWADRPEPDDRTWADVGVPVEIMIALANELDADPWFNMPHLSNAEYVTRFAETVRAELEPQLIAYVEHSNEVWNWGFAQAQYANMAGRARWGDVGDAYMQWHGMRTAEICDLWKGTVFAADAGRVRCVLGTQTGWRGLETPALDCPLWVAESPGRAPCYQHGIDALGVTGYFSGCLAGSSGWPPQDFTDLIRSWFADGDGGMTKGMEQVANGAHFECGDTVAGNADTYAYFKDVVDARGLEMVAYEGGQHITGNGQSIQDDPGFIAFHIGLNRDPRMKDRYLENFANWRDAGGTLFMHFVDVSSPSKWGSWGALEWLGQETSPKWEAVVEFNQIACWWEGC